MREVFCAQSVTNLVRPQKNFVLPQYSIPQKKKWIFKQSAAPTLATLAGAANGLRPLAARGLAGINKAVLDVECSAGYSHITYFF